MFSKVKYWSSSTIHFSRSFTGICHTLLAILLNPYLCERMLVTFAFQENMYMTGLSFTSSEIATKINTLRNAYCPIRPLPVGKDTENPRDTK